MNKVFKFLSIFLLILFIGFGVLWYFIGPVDKNNEEQVFVVPQYDFSFDPTTDLYQKKLIKNKWAFELLRDNFFEGKDIKPGGYKLSSSMNSYQILKKITDKQDFFWFKISFCARREQIGEKLSETLGWGDEDLDKWNSAYKKLGSDYSEGVYYPDTYLLPVDESGDQIAMRFINRFNEKIAPYSNELLEKNIKWTTALKIASLIAREAAGTADDNLISGIIWNRLDQGMRLQIDSTMQYTYGKNEDGTWWGPIDLDQKLSESPYNTYLHKGLPPTPICSPDIDAIVSVLEPTETDCLFYLHDSAKQIHCAKTYAEHKSNIVKYLK